jgi:hypothetical protein
MASQVKFSGMHEIIPLPGNDKSSYRYRVAGGQVFFSCKLVVMLNCPIRQIVSFCLVVVELNAKPSGSSFKQTGLVVGSVNSVRRVVCQANRFRLREQPTLDGIRQHDHIGGCPPNRVVHVATGVKRREVGYQPEHLIAQQ